jgi:hypothetical protein
MIAAGFVVGAWGVTVPVAYVLCFQEHEGLIGIWRGLVIGTVLIGIGAVLTIVIDTVLIVIGAVIIIVVIILIGAVILIVIGAIVIIIVIGAVMPCPLSLYTLLYVSRFLSALPSMDPCRCVCSVVILVAVAPLTLFCGFRCAAVQAIRS